VHDNKMRKICKKLSREFLEKKLSTPIVTTAIKTRIYQNQHAKEQCQTACSIAPRKTFLDALQNLVSDLLVSTIFPAVIVSHNTRPSVGLSQNDFNARFEFPNIVHLDLGSPVLFPVLPVCSLKVLPGRQDRLGAVVGDARVAQ